MDKCVNCNADLTPDSLFCANCGHKVEHTEQLEHQPQEVTKKESGKKKRADKKKEKAASVAIEEPTAAEQANYATPVASGVPVNPPTMPPTTPPATPPPFIIDDVAQHTVVSGQGTVVAKPKGKRVKRIVITAIVLAIVGALWYLISNISLSEKAKYTDYGIVYLRDDGVVCMMDEKANKGLSISRDMDFDNNYSRNSIAFDSTKKMIAYIDSFGDIYSVPVKELDQSDRPSHRDYKVDGSSARIIGYDKGAKNLYYINRDSDLMVFDGTEKTRVEREVAIVRILDDGSLLLIRNKEENNASYGYNIEEENTFYYAVKKNKGYEVNEIARDIDPSVGSLVVGGKTPKIYYKASDSRADDDKEYDLFEYNPKNKESNRIVKGVGIIYSVENELFLYTKPIDNDIEELYYMENGKENLIASGIGRNMFVEFSTENRWVIYSSNRGGSSRYSDNNLVYYQTFTGDPQELGEHTANEYWTATVNSSNTQLMFALYEFTDFIGGDLMHFNISARGILGEGNRVDRDVYSLFESIGEGYFYYSKNLDDSMEIIDLYRSDGKNTEEIAKDVNVLYLQKYLEDRYLQARYNSNAKSNTDTTLLYLKNMDSRHEFGELVLFKNGKEVSISKGVSYTQDNTYFTDNIFYRSDKKIYFLKDFSERRGTGDVYVYKGGNRTELVEQDVEYMFRIYY